LKKFKQLNLKQKYQIQALLIDGKTYTAIAVSSWCAKVHHQRANGHEQAQYFKITLLLNTS
jgi:hypothetical protein